MGSLNVWLRGFSINETGKTELFHRNLIVKPFEGIQFAILPPFDELGQKDLQASARSPYCQAKGGRCFAFSIAGIYMDISFHLVPVFPYCQTFFLIPSIAHRKSIHPWE
jgi:hypothetical protein